jgi:hypothetical protein
MSKKRRRSSNRLLDYAARLIIVLGLLAYVPITAWWKNIAPTDRVFLILMATFAIIGGTAAVLAFAIYRKRERARIWQRAMTGWQNSIQSNLVAEKQSAIYMSEVELEKFAAQVYKKMGYKVQHVGQMGDHGIDVLLVNPHNQKEIVQCKQWNKPVGEPAIRDLYGAMMHEKAARGWLWAPRGFSARAREWAKGKAITLMDDKEIDRLIRIAYGKK